MTTIPIVKMSGSGNLFVVVDNREGLLNGSLEAFARRVCEMEKTDGLLLVERPDRDSEHFKMHFFNPDGSEVGMCGNGARCIAYYAATELGMPDKISFSVQGVARPVSAIVDRTKRWVEVELDDVTGYRAGFLKAKDAGLPPLSEVSFVMSGVPHAVVWVEDLEHTDVGRLGSAIRRHAVFHETQGTNVNFVVCKGPQRLAIRTYERGVERETGACGTGAAAASAVAAIEEKIKPVSGQQYRVSLKTRSGEELMVSFVLGSNREAGQVRLAGGVRVLGQKEFVS